MLRLNPATHADGVNQRDTAEHEAIDEPKNEAATFDVGDEPSAESHRKPNCEKDFHPMTPLI